MHFLNEQPQAPSVHGVFHNLAIVFMSRRASCKYLDHNEQHGWPRYHGRFALAEEDYIWSHIRTLPSSATFFALHGMAISGSQLAEILKSFGASPEEIAAAATELSQSVASTNTVSASPNTASAPSAQPSQHGMSTSAIPSDVVPHPYGPTQALPTQPVSPALAVPSPLPSTMPLHPTSIMQSGAPGPAPLLPPNHQSVHAALPHAVLTPPISSSSLPPSFLPRAAGAAEYFETGNRGPSMQPNHSRAMHGLQQLAMSSSVHGANISLTAPPVQSAPVPSPWDIPAPRSSHWGATGVTTTPQAGMLPRALGSMLALGPTGSQHSPQIPSSPLITSSTPVPKPNRRKSSSSKAKAPPARKPVGQKTVYLVPKNNVTQLTAKVKAACDYADLTASPELWVDMSSSEVRGALQAPFESIIDFKIYAYQLFYITRGLGPTLCPAGSDLPNGTKLRDLYQKRQVLVMWLLYDADAPSYDEGIRLYEKNRKKRGGDEDEESEEAQESEEEEEEEETFVCHFCRGTFAAGDAESHEEKCPARRKRRLSNQNTHTRHHSVPAILSPERKRSRKSREASSDGEAELRGVVGRRGRVLEMPDLDEEEQAEVEGDPEADEEDLEDTMGGTASRVLSRGVVGISIDTETLCSFCDDPLPSGVSPRYWTVHNVLIKEGQVQPSFKNPQHIDLPLHRSFEVCQFHQEARRSSIANGVARGYPEVIDFSAIPSRLQRKLDAIKEAMFRPLLHKSLEPFRYGELPLKSLGDRMAAATAAHAGYYGPKGYGIILNFLTLNLFQLSSTPSSVLQKTDFLAFMLTPYAAFLLISEDMQSTSVAEAWNTWEDSKDYGLASFPEDD
ncbi:hypothetical protein M407DRAFT_31361 [Tulasnella calospora MUT 4182]|uniref:Restriction of telomere capping protein 4 n=1 Tax=Tulasnella calospora MUT 4182 TaxID=1051891 RepID=A0A0C3LBY0_9AGAM|nr:hypothetical protein M407DRAFT_31361 [Tulasnella calospora MUT 4182]